MGDAGGEARLRTLMVRYQAGDAAAFDELYAELAPVLRRYLLALARRVDRADDLLQETFLQLHRSRHTYGADRPVRPWAFAIARNVWLMHERTRRRREPPQVDLEWVAEVAGARPEAEALPLREDVRRALARLPADRAEVLLLHHVWGFTFDEIGKILGIRAGAARVRASRAMGVMRGLLT
jgi:RNA polymerase sigma-70 factor (ECF subfamily)